MKYTFNSVEFIVEGAQWWIAPEALPSTKWIVGLKHNLENGGTGTVVKVRESQASAESALASVLRDLQVLRNERAAVVSRIFTSLRIADLADRERFSKYVNYWLDRELSPTMIVERFPKDHKKWIPPPRPPERADSNRNPYYAGTNTAAQGLRDRIAQQNELARAQGYRSIEDMAREEYARQEGLRQSHVHIPQLAEELARNNLANSNMVEFEGNQYTITGNHAQVRNDLEAAIDEAAFVAQRQDAQLQRALALTPDSPVVRLDAPMLEDSAYWFQAGVTTTTPSNTITYSLEYEPVQPRPETENENIESDSPDGIPDWAFEE
jgi:hypothetical protein